MTIKLSLPPDVVIKPKKGDAVNFGDPLYEYSFSKKITINIAQKLGIKPDNIFQYLVKIIGEPIRKGELLAVKKSFFSPKKIYSSYDGIIKDINHQTGEVIIMSNKDCQKKVIVANFKGVIEDFNQTYLKIKIKEGKPFFLKEINQDGGGESYYFQSENSFFRLNEEEITDKIIIIENLKLIIEVKCEALGAKGFVFLKGQPSTNLPWAKIKNIDDYQKLYQLKKKYVIFSKRDKIAVVYD